MGTACGECGRCVEELLGLVGELADPSDCDYDAAGRCRTHQMAERPCPHERAAKIVIEWSSTE